MDGIPPALDTDVEDVVWALQTADALWKRNERGDALVWLRRAAQAAGDANDDDRALALARGAAELTESMAQAPDLEGAQGRDAPVPAAPPAPRAGSGSFAPGALGSARAPAPKVPIAPPPPRPPEPPEPTRVVEVAPPPAPAPRVPTAAESHAGMLDPWADPDAPRSSARPSSRRRELPSAFEDDEVVTSAKPHPARPPPPPAPRRPEPRAPEPPAESNGATAAAHADPVPASPAPLDLSRIDAFGDLPDDVRTRFAAAASVHTLARGDEIPSFALAFLSDGTTDVLAVGVPGAATSLSAGAVLRARGTLQPPIAIRLVCASDTATVATWNEDDVAGVSGPCPWVEDDLCAAGDRVQALAGLSLGPLGRSAYDRVRPVLADRLVLRALVAGEAFLREADPVHGLFVVGSGEVELSGGDGAKAMLAAGAFVFPAQTLSMGRAPMTARAGSAGALILLADRSTTQELLVTQPLLLELLAG
jgi:hypothetical protein